MQTKTKKKSLLPVLLFIAILAVVVFVFRREVVQLFSVLTDASMTNEEQREVLSLIFGTKGAVIFSALSALQIIIPIFPAEPFQVICGIGYGFAKAFLICMVGVFIGNSVIYLLSNAWGEKIAKYLDTHIEVDFTSAKIQNKLFPVIFLLYILPAIPYGMICFLAASSGLKYPKYISFTLVSSMPSVAIGIALGSLTIGLGLYTGLLTLVLLIALIILAYRKRDKLTNAINQILKPYSSATKVKKPNRFIYSVAKTVCSLLFGSKIDIRLKNKIKLPDNEPCIVIGSHPSFLDWYYTALVFYPKKLNFITSRYYFFRRDLAFLIRNVGCIPKSMFSPDLECAKNMITVLRRNDTLALLPEAQLSTMGRFESIHQPTIDFIKNSALPVYFVQINGAYLAKPKAGNGIRRGARVEISAGKLFEKGETKAMSSSEVRDAVEKALYFNDFEWLNTQPDLHYKSSKLAEGLENLIYLCPKCRKEASLSTSGNTISCECGFTLTLNDRYTFTNENTPFKNQQEWYDFQVKEFEKEVQNDNFSLSSPVTLHLPSHDGKHIVEKAGTGICTLNKDGLVYKGTMSEEETTLTFPMDSVYRLLFGAGENFEIYKGSDYYYFAPENPKLSVKWYIASILLHKKHTEKKDGEK
ncbi:MAG: VTT domain-containing protein [Clostridia bacterium]|nr:VTT domain-containing protein [Clostridia bacterium]